MLEKNSFHSPKLSEPLGQAQSHQSYLLPHFLGSFDSFFIFKKWEELDERRAEMTVCDRLPV